MKNRREKWGTYSWKYIAPGFYEDISSGKVLVVTVDGKCFCGRVRKRIPRSELGFYKSYVYRDGKKIVEKYVGLCFK